MEFQKKDAIYLQIADLMCERILLKEWQENDRIPSVRELAVGLEVNPNTVMRAYAFLQEKGIIFNKRGIGYFVSSEGLKITRNLYRSNFIRNDLPQLYKTLKLLDMDFKEFYSLYNEFKEKEK
ncbi:MAG: GntR family transcriptional regulator [Deltaproteobacteria bacterium]|jgi:GntR family transcriptional regulator|nr:GntR family transcriptional regulator [Deltaproteobacteria bacterium]